MEFLASLNQKLGKAAQFDAIFTINLQNSCNYLNDLPTEK